jgi:hypothetical protein
MSVIENRLSSLTLSNDTMEGKLVASAVGRLAEKDGLDRTARDRFQHAITVLEDSSSRRLTIA